MDLRGKVAIVTGSSSPAGVGGETAKALAAKGCRVAVNYANNRSGADEVVSACLAAGTDAFAVQADVANDVDCRRLIDATAARWSRIDVLVNNAAVTRPIPLPDLEALDADEFQRIYATNVIGVYQMTRAAASHLKASGDAAVVNISSVAGLLGSGSSIAYAASKGALNTLTFSFARVLAPKVRVNAICPGGLLGGWTQKIMTEDEYALKLREAEAASLLRRGVWPADVARCALFLIEDAATLTGELVRLDGGKHLF